MLFIFFCKQKPAYEMRISDWSSDVCSSDLMGREVGLPIGALASRTGTKVNTIRFYEDIRLLPPAARTASGRRSYGPEDVRRLAFIRSEIGRASCRGKSVSVRVDLGGRRIIKKQKMMI